MRSTVTATLTGTAGFNEAGARMLRKWGVAETTADGSRRLQ